MKSFSDCKYSAFISYAHADDQATDGWISQFSDFLGCGCRTDSAASA